jgi:hypothetical protein
VRFSLDSSRQDNQVNDGATVRVAVRCGAYPCVVVDWRFPRDDRDPFEQIAQLPPPTSSDPRKQHVITRALLKGFAEPGTAGKGWTLTPYDVVNQRLLKPTGLRGCGFVLDFIMYAAQSAESTWKSVEDDLPAAIGAARAGNLHRAENSRLRDTITDAIALHYVRAPRLRQQHSELTEKVTHAVRARTLTQRPAALEREFFKRTGLMPAGPEALDAVLDDVMRPWRDSVERGALARVSLVSLFERISAGLRGLPIEVWHTAPGSELLISDNAAFTFAFSPDGTSAETNMAFGDSQGAALPIARDCLVAIGSTPRDELLPSGTASLLNELQVCNADTYVYFRPGSNLATFVDRAVRTRAGKVTRVLMSGEQGAPPPS